MYALQTPGMLFQIGERVVYPDHGVGVIENVSSRSFGDQYERFYLLRLMCNSLTVMVPISNAGALGLRKVTRNGEISKVLYFLSNGRCGYKGDWKGRSKVNSEKMRSGGLSEVAEVLKSLLTLQLSKPLSFREKRILDRARRMLITEVSVSRSMSEFEATEMLHKALARASLALPPPL